MIARVTAMLSEMALARSVQVVLENPPSSVIWRFEPVKRVLEEHNFVHHALCSHCAFDTDRALGERFKKQFKFVSASPWILQLSRRCQCGEGVGHVDLMPTFIQADTGKAKSVGQTRCTGNKQALKESQKYTPESWLRTFVSAGLRSPILASFSKPTT